MNLSEEQTTALDHVKKFIKDEFPDVCFTITGPAGTGKTSIMSVLIQYLEQSGHDYVLCAPTHKAAMVLKSKTNREVMTLHKLLTLSPNLDILKLDLNNLLFKVGSASTEIPYKGVVIVDEASMINDDLFDLLIQKCKEAHSGVVFLGDAAQLQPVKGENIAKVFRCNNIFYLKQIYRQSEQNALLPVLTTLRTASIKAFKTLKSPEGNLILSSDLNVFLKAARRKIEDAKDQHNLMGAKILAYTNARVDAYNKVIHRAFTTDEYARDEIITIGENFGKGNNALYNSMDYYITQDPLLNDIYIPSVGICMGWTLKLYDVVTRNEISVNVLSAHNPVEVFNQIATELEHARLTAISKKSSMYWKKYYSINEAFLSPIDLTYEDRLVKKAGISYGYASTVHKAQGSEYETVFIDMKDILTCRDPQNLRQLQYVGVSRTRKNCVLYV